MNITTLALLKKHFDLAIIAPDGIKRLRELILTLAMQGKLVPQDPNDQSARELLKEIEAEKKRLVKEGKIKELKPLPEIKPEEVPYAVPKGWEWVNICTVSELKTGATPSSSMESYYNGNIRWLVSGDINKRIIFDCEGRISDKGMNNSNCKILPPNSLLIALNGQGKTRATVAILKVEATCNQSLIAIIPLREREIITTYLYWNLRSRYKELRDETGDDKRSGLNMKIISRLSIPLPPLAEQKRIVAKIDQLMATCDALEKQRNSRQQMRQDIHSAAITRLLDAAQGADTSQSAWFFLQKHFGELYSVKENVAELRKAILQLAVTGRLLKKASEWKKEKLIDLTTKIGSGSTPSGGKSNYKSAGIPLIRSMNVHFGGFRKEGLAFIDDEQAKKLNNVIVQNQDILFNITGASIGRVSLAPSEMEGARVNQHVCILRVIDKILPQFLELYLSCPHIQKMIDDIQVGATREALTKVKIENFEIELPLISEQNVIIKKIDELMALCDKLEQGIEATTKKQSAILEAVVAQV